MKLLSTKTINELMEKVKEKALKCKEFAIEFKYNDQRSQLWFDFRTEDYKLSISKSAYTTLLSETEKDENGEYRFRMINYKSVECFECFLSAIEKTIKELVLKHRHKEFFLNVSNKE